MSNRLLIKSVMCACDQGVWPKEERNAEGEITKSRTLLKAPVRMERDSKPEYTIDLPNNKLIVKVDGQTHELPIDPYSRKFADRASNGRREET